MADLHDIDELIADLEAEGEVASGKAWSFNELDELLGLGKDEEKEEIEDREHKKIDLSDIDIGDDVEFDIEEPVEDEEWEEEARADYEPEPEPEVAPEPKAMPRKEQKTVVFDADVVNKISRSQEINVADPVDDELDKVDFKKIKQGQTQVLMALADDEDMEETEVPSKEREIEPETEEEILNRKALAQKTIGIHPIRNEAINHQIVTEQVEKSAVKMETNKYRERFLNVPKQHLERTAEHEALHAGEQLLVEKAGHIVKRSKFKNTADLEPVPMIVSADEELSNFDKTIVANSDAKIIEREEEDDMDGQIKILGFGEEEELLQIDEENAEEELRRERDQKVSSFKLDADFIDDEEDIEIEDEPAPRRIPRPSFTSSYIEDEYDEPEDEDRIRKALENATKNTAIFTVVQFVLTIVALIVTGLVSKSGGNLEVIGGGPLGCGLVNIIILLFASALGLNTLVSGFNALVAKKPNAASGTLIVVAACFIENIAIMFFTIDEYTTIPIYTAAALMALTLSSVAKFISLYRALGNFEFITNGTQLYSTEHIWGEDDAFEIGRGLLIGDPEICYNARMDRPSYFIENSFEDDPADFQASKLNFIPIIAGALFGIIFGIVHKDFVFAVGTFAAVTAIGIPAFSLIASNINLLLVNKKFNQNGGAIVGHRAIEDSTEANAYVLDATDIFKKGSSSIIGIKTFYNMRIDDAILYAAALVIESGGPLEDIFDNVILGKKDLLPPVESLAYEERLGLSSWIHGRRVLFGTRDLLINHNVEAPPKDFEKQYLHDDRNVIYLAIAGKIAAMFVVKYVPDKKIGKYLRSLDRAGVSILVRSQDCNITEEMICRHFKLPSSAVKVLSPVSGDIFQKYREEDVETAPAGIIHNGTLEASVSAFYEARQLHDNRYLNKLVATIYTFMAIIFVFIMSLIGGAESVGITGGQIVIFQFVWTLIATAVPIIKRKVDR